MLTTILESAPSTVVPLYVTWVLGKDYRLIEPDFHYQVVGLDGKASSDVITVGNDGTVKAVGNGTAIVLVTYD